ncbi:hypothetical protein D5R93_07565 [Actinomyces lilanjuaniae]|uniref:DUF8175 domain-containing protein n=1 Tax=Actinomyces lilanjuaniae TaxID=2321394 RepID=A0ABN5PSI4_9ACTO|nr:hypothetical protein [Actinomyces lilanjuaniae]AYD89917.1 hypothetical protein D5R93_07565 [Actinomyces lilanjuaniae]
MSTSDSTGAQGRSPLTRPGFIAATALVVVIAVVAAALALANTMSSREDTAAAEGPASTEATGPVEIPPPSTAGPDHDGTQSVCGLEGEVTEQARLSQAPDVDYWDYQGTMAYPVSVEYGPAATDSDGFRYCFQHSPEGALYAAANAVSQGSDPTGEWLSYVVADGPYRDQLVSDTGTDETDAGTGEDSDETRISIVGFRLLEYEGSTARVDIAGRATVEGQTLTVSGVYELVWQGGDWKLSSEVAEPLTLAEIPDTSGYVIWGEQPGG